MFVLHQVVFGRHTNGKPSRLDTKRKCSAMAVSAVSLSVVEKPNKRALCKMFSAAGCDAPLASGDTAVCTVCTPSFIASRIIQRSQTRGAMTV